MSPPLSCAKSWCGQLGGDVGRTLPAPAHRWKSHSLETGPGVALQVSAWTERCLFTGGRAWLRVHVLVAQGSPGEGSHPPLPFPGPHWVTLSLPTFSPIAGMALLPGALLSVDSTLTDQEAFQWHGAWSGTLGDPAAPASAATGAGVAGADRRARPKSRPCASGAGTQRERKPQGSPQWVPQPHTGSHSWLPEHSAHPPPPGASPSGLGWQRC